MLQAVAIEFHLRLRGLTALLAVSLVSNLAFVAPKEMTDLKMKP